MKTGLPLNLFLVILVTVLFVFFLIPANLGKVIFYAAFVFLFLYILLSRYAGTIEITNNELHIRYLFPWNKNVFIKIDTITDVKYQKGFYDLFADKTMGGAFVFPLYCYDKIICNRYGMNSIEEIDININTRIFGFDKAIKYLRDVLNDKRPSEK